MYANPCLALPESKNLLFHPLHLLQGLRNGRNRGLLINIPFALLSVTISVTTLLISPAEMQEPGHIYKQEVTQIQPIKADVLPQPLPEAETVVEKKIPSGTHEEWMAAAGISPGDYASVNFIVSHESGWRPDAINPSSGSCGLVQALPCSKLGADWSNPVQALSWASKYVTARYGGWDGAVAFWNAHGWY